MPFLIKPGITYEEVVSKVMKRIIAGKTVRRKVLIFNLRVLIDFLASRQNLTFETASCQQLWKKYIKTQIVT